ncbi:ankyrin repeat-containing domain protein [Microdochium bolleyi]|uniref:Ankyrin repeat-containing domain protein n=1 Tax=Microdochium bolleyi TaxID=196109 RepID=A0A136J8N0_9PEZI|nr:ankyrin repeat-containing domain protein [Microdochium bolleyi]
MATPPHDRASWASLPTELVLLIAECLPLEDLARLAAINRAHRQALLPDLARQAYALYPHLFFWASSLGLADLVTAFLDAGANPNVYFESEQVTFWGPARIPRVQDRRAQSILHDVYRHRHWELYHRRRIEREGGGGGGGGGGGDADYDDAMYAAMASGRVGEDPRDPLDRHELSEKPLRKWWTALHAAAHHGRSDVVRLLVARGARLEASSRDMCFCILPRALRTKRPSDDERQWGRHLVPARWTPLHSAICGGHGDTAELLMSLGARRDNLDHIGGAVSAFQSAVVYGLSGTARAIWEGASEYERVRLVEADAGGLTPLAHHIVGDGDPAFTSTLIRYGCSVDDAGGPGRSALELACIYGRFDIAVELEPHTPYINAIWGVEDRHSPFGEVARAVERACVPSSRYAQRHLSVYGGVENGGRESWEAPRLAFLARILRRGAHIQPLAAARHSPATLAAWSLCPETLSLLVAAGADITQPDSTRQYPLLAAVAEWPFRLRDARDPVRTLAWLLEHGADPDQTSRRGRTALWKICRNNQMSTETQMRCVDELVRHGADICTKDNARVPAIHLALKKRNFEVCRHLLGHGARFEAPFDMVTIARMLISEARPPRKLRKSNEKAGVWQPRLCMDFLLELDREEKALFNDPMLFWEATKYPFSQLANKLLDAGYTNVTFSPPGAGQETCLHNIMRASTPNETYEDEDALLRRLIQLGADINKGRPIITAMSRHRLTAVSILLDAGVVVPGIAREVLEKALLLDRPASWSELREITIAMKRWVRRSRETESGKVLT